MTDSHVMIRDTFSLVGRDMSLERERNSLVTLTQETGNRLYVSTFLDIRHKRDSRATI